MRSIRPTSLKAGDNIRIIATARSVEKDMIRTSVMEIKSWDLDVSYGMHLFSNYRQYSGTDKERLADLNDAIRDNNCKAILCARGGYGSVRLLQDIDLDTLQRNPKWIIGYSDVTAIFHHVFQSIALIGIHASMPINFKSNTKTSLKGLKDVLFGELPSHTFPSHELNRIGQVSGTMVGGNLSVIYSMLGSTAQLKTQGVILFLEDLDEYLYHIDRMMMALQRAGMLHGLAGLIVGGMSDMNDNTVPFGLSANEIIAEAVADYSYPVCFGFPAGHVADNRPWLHGGNVHLSVKSGATSWKSLE